MGARGAGRPAAGPPQGAEAQPGRQGPGGRAAHLPLLLHRLQAGAQRAAARAVRDDGQQQRRHGGLAGQAGVQAGGLAADAPLRRRRRGRRARLLLDQAQLVARQRVLLQHVQGIRVLHELEHLWRGSEVSGVRCAACSGVWASGRASGLRVSARVALAPQQPRSSSPAAAGGAAAQLQAQQQQQQQPPRPSTHARAPHLVHHKVAHLEGQVEGRHAVVAGGAGEGGGAAAVHQVQRHHACGAGREGGEHRARRRGRASAWASGQAAEKQPQGAQRPWQGSGGGSSSGWSGAAAHRHRPAWPRDAAA
jgi:hypothetical protein